MNLAGDIMECPVEFSSSSDRDLAERLLRGDRDAFTTVYRVHSPGVFRFAYHMTGDRSKAAEITQEVFVWLIRHPRGYDPERGSFAPFLTGVTRQCVRRQRRTDLRWTPFAESARDCSRNAADPDRAIDLETLRQAIAVLPLRYREVIVLYDLEGNSYEQTAAVLNCSVGTVRSRLHRARGLLARKFQRRMNP